ncbi:Rab-GAP TBC domain-containing protein [Trichostrongylus colubriformis]|uniref:Rab-GAP TBC domain-containing protein n=1 Tax=Trichostrongylus colubriformis TaxID=6319 RepID=A0AAN8FKS7_TRICO
MSTFQVSDIAPLELPNNLLQYYDDECGGHTVSYDGMCFYDPVQETDILGDDASEEASEVYEPGTYNGADVGTSSSGEEDDPELRELEERDNIVLKYEKGPESKDIDPWENPEFDVYAKMDRFGFVRKNSSEAAEEERANRRRIAKEVKRENKWLAMDQAWKKDRLPKKLEERTWKGIPEKLRMKVWPRLLGAYELKEARPNLFQEILKRALLVSKDIKQIDLDINRTYRDHMAFRRRYDVKQQSLLNVLAAYAMYNTEVGYCQGMSQIAALFLMYLDEEDTFWCMHALMVGKKHTMHGFFVPGFPKLSRFEAHFKKILKKYKPRVKKNDIPYIYLTKWWFGCFLDRVPFSLALSYRHILCGAAPQGVTSQ